MAVFSDFYDRILPYVREGYPELVNDHLRATIRQFLQVSTAWREVLEVESRYDADPIPLQPEHGVVGGVLTVAILGQKQPLRFVPEPYRPAAGTRLPTGTPTGWWWLAPASIRLNKLVSSNLSALRLRVEVYKQLGLHTYDTWVPDFLLDQHREAIASGALGSIMAMPTKPWSDAATAVAHTSAFTSAMTNLRAALRGLQPHVSLANEVVMPTATSGGA